MNHLVTSLYLFLVATLHAKLEIMIEDKEGWAKKLPCWRLNTALIKLIIGKDLSGYHFYMLLMFIVLFHGIFLVSPWTGQAEFLVLGYFCVYWLAEDLMWFILNPHYTWKKFKKNHIAWHRRWFIGIPVSYWLSGIVGGILLYLGRK